MDDSKRSLTVVIESSVDWSKATILAEYEVNRNTAIENSINIATRIDAILKFIVYPRQNIIFNYYLYIIYLLI